MLISWLNKIRQKKKKKTLSTVQSCVYMYLSLLLYPWHTINSCYNDAGVCAIIAISSAGSMPPHSKGPVLQPNGNFCSATVR